MTELVDALKALSPENVDEKSIEVKDVTVKLSFQFEDGEIKDPVQAQIYEMLKTENAIIDESLTEEADSTVDNEFQE